LDLFSGDSGSFYQGKHDLFPYKAIGLSPVFPLIMAPAQVMWHNEAIDELKRFIAALRRERACVIGLLRDPRDVVISACYFNEAEDRPCHPEKYMRTHLEFTVSWTKLRWEVFAQVKEKVPNRFFFMYYEDLKARFVPMVMRLARQIGLPVTEEQVRDIQAEASLKQLKKKERAGELPDNLQRAGQNTAKVRSGETCGFLSEVSSQTAQWAAQQMEALPNEIRRKFKCPKSPK
jgi:hypothetical protein